MSNVAKPRAKRTKEPALYHGPMRAHWEVKLLDSGGLSTASYEGARGEAAYWTKEGRPYRVTRIEVCPAPGCDGHGRRSVPGRGRTWRDVDCVQCRGTHATEEDLATFILPCLACQRGERCWRYGRCKEEGFVPAAAPSERRYHVVAINERTGNKVCRTSEAVTHEEGRTLMRKLTQAPHVRIQLEEVTANKDANREYLARVATREAREMSDLLRAKGYADADTIAARLVAEGMGPDELAERLAIPEGAVGSLAYTHGIKRGPTLSYATWCDQVGHPDPKIDGRNIRIAFGPETHDAWQAGETPQAFRDRLYAAQIEAQYAPTREDLVKQHEQARDRWLALQAGPKYRERQAAYDEMAALAERIDAIDVMQRAQARFEGLSPEGRRYCATNGADEYAQGESGAVRLALAKLCCEWVARGNAPTE